MAFIIEINGSITPRFLELNGIAEVTPERRADIETNLKQGNFVIGLASGEVHSLPNLELVAKFDFEINDDTEYEFTDYE